MAARVLARHNERSRLNENAPDAPRPGAKPESMVRCEHCGIHLPRSEAVLIDGHTWCSQEHARLGPANVKRPY
nr:PP0621 family protein [Parapusillimonas granuli]